MLLRYRRGIEIGVGTTLLYSAIVIGASLAVGVIVGLGRTSSSRLVRNILRMYVEVFRCTPVLVQLIWFYYALPVLLNLELSPGTAAVLALTLYGGAFYSEIVRAGIVSIDVGQWNAAQALGMTKWQAMRHVIMRQAARRMIPPLINQSVIQLKNTSLLSVIAVPDLLYQGNVIAQDTYRPLEAYTFIAIIYLLILLPITMLARRVGASASRNDTSGLAKAPPW